MRREKKNLTACAHWVEGLEQSGKSWWEADLCWWVALAAVSIRKGQNRTWRFQWARCVLPCASHAVPPGEGCAAAGAPLITSYCQWQTAPRSLKAQGRFCLLAQVTHASHVACASLLLCCLHLPAHPAARHCLALIPCWVTVLPGKVPPTQEAGSVTSSFTQDSSVAWNRKGWADYLVPFTFVK